MVRSLTLLTAMSLTPWAAFASAPCPSIDPPQMADAQQGMAWVGVMHDPPPNDPFQFCPPDKDDMYKRGLLFGVTHEDCPNGCSGHARPETVEFVAPGASPPASIIGTMKQLPTKLSRYCVYLPDQPGHTIPPAFNPGELLMEPEQAPMAIAASGFEDTLDDYYRDLTLDNVSFCPTSHIAAQSRLTLLDTAQTEVWDTGADTAAHGRTLARLVERLGCDPYDRTSCPFELRTRSALPLVDVVPTPMWDVPGGGHFGSTDWLAQALVRELAAWDLAGRPQLVLNLSLAWHEDWGGGQIGQGLATCERPDVLAVYDAIRKARCEGALIIASAGNRTAAGTDGGRMYPAAWAELRITPEDCDDDFDIVNAPLDPNGSPLVFAAAGVSDDGDPIALARPQAMPHLLAYADHVAIPGTDPMTGNSVAAAFVSAEAARIWSETPPLTADQVMAEVWSRATPTTTTATGPYAGNQSWFDPGAGGSLPARLVGSCQPPFGVPLPAFPPPDEEVWNLPSSVLDPLASMAPTGGYLPFVTPTPGTTTCPSCTWARLSQTLTFDVRGFNPVTEVELSLYPPTGPAEVISLRQRTNGTIRLPNAPQTVKRATLQFEGEEDGKRVTYVAEVAVR